MSARIEIQVRQNRFPELADIDWTPAFARIGVYYDAQMAEMFATSGTSRGHKWPELAPSTLIQKVRSGASTEILQRRGILRASYRVLTLNRDRLVFGTDVSYAKYHDSDRPRELAEDGTVRLPQRKQIRITARDIEVTELHLRQHLVDVAGGRGGTGV